MPDFLKKCGDIPVCDALLLLYPRSKTAHQAVVIYAVEELFQIKVNDVAVTLFKEIKCNIVGRSRR